MRRFIALLGLLILLALLPGCVRASDARSRAPLTASVQGLEMSPRELRIRVRALIRPTLGLIEEGGDRVLAETDDPAIRRAALILKIEFTTTLLTALLRDDPVLALADAMGYMAQVEDFVDRPEFREQFGEFAVDARVTADRIHQLLFEFADGVQEDLSATEFDKTMRSWARDHPIEGSIYRRPTVDAEVAGLFAASSGRGALAAIGSLEETTEEIMMRMDLYTVYLPRLARWEAEVALVDVVGATDLESVGTEFERFTRAADRIAGVAERAEGLVERERTAALDAVRAERIAATADLRAGRVAILDAVHDERVATLLEIEAVAARLLDRTGGPLHATMRSETDRLVESVEVMRLQLIEDAGGVLNTVVDHLFVRALQLLLIVAALAAIGVVLHARFLRPRRDVA